MQAVLRNEYFTAKAGTDLVLDASKSRNLDEPGNLIEGLSFEWTCESNVLDGLNVDQSLLIIPSSRVEGMEKVKIDVTVFKGKKYLNDTLSDTASATIVIVEGDIPSLFIDPLAKKRTNSGDKLIIRGGTLSKAGNVQMEWSTVIVEELPQQDQGELQIDQSMVVITDNKEALLVIPPFSLNKGLVYTFELKGFFNKSLDTAISRIRVLVNRPPVLGDIQTKFAKDGSLGDVFTTQVFFTDDPIDLPLKYEFGYSVDVIEDSANVTEILGKIDASFGSSDSGTLSTLLPMNKNRGNITLICIAEDQNGERSYYTVPLYISPIPGLINREGINSPSNSTISSDPNSTLLSSQEAVNNQELLNNVALSLLDATSPNSLQLLVAQQLFEKAKSISSFITSVLLISSSETAVAIAERDVNSGKKCMT